MKKHITIVTFLVGSLLLWCGFIQPAQDKGCLSHLREYADKMAKVDFPKDGRVYFIDMELIGVASTGESFKSRTKTYLTNKSLAMESSLMSSYIDFNDAFVVDHTQKTIYRSKGSEDFSKFDADPLKMAENQKEFLENAVVRTCKDVEYEGKTVKFIYLNINEETRNVTKVRNIAYYFDTRSSVIEKMIIYFAKGEELDKQTIINKKTDFNYKGYKVLPAKSKVLSASGKLLPAFAGYQLVDAR